MKFLLAVGLLLIASTSFGQSYLAACGAPEARFKVVESKASQLATAPEAGKALVVFVEDNRQLHGWGSPTTRLGIDGVWAGATQGNSYFSTSTTPGEHHLCARWQTNGRLTEAPQPYAIHFTAEAGKTYYFLVTNVRAQLDESAQLSLHPLDSDEAQILIAGSRPVTATPDKPAKYPAGQN